MSVCGIIARSDERKNFLIIRLLVKLSKLGYNVDERIIRLDEKLLDQVQSGYRSSTTGMLIFAVIIIMLSKNGIVMSTLRRVL